MGLFTAKKATLVFKRPASISTAGFCLNKKLCLSDYFFLGHYERVHFTVGTLQCPRPLLSAIMISDHAADFRLSDLLRNFTAYSWNIIVTISIIFDPIKPP